VWRRYLTRLGTRTKETTSASGVEGDEARLWDPKDSELCVSGVKADESVLEAPRRSDVQLDVVRWA